MFDLPSVIRNNAFLLLLRVSGTISSMVLFNAILVAVPPAIKSRFSKKISVYFIKYIFSKPTDEFSKDGGTKLLHKGGARVVLMESIVGEVLMKKSWQEENEEHKKMILIMIILIKR